MAPGKKNIIFIFIFLIFPLFLYAQNFGESSSHIENTSDGIRFIQTIVFPYIPDTLRYEVEIERIDGEAHALVEYIISETNSVDVSLSAGRYRYRYTAINRMNVIEGISLWEEFIIIPAFMPNPRSYQPYYALYFEMADPHGVLIINGEDIFQDSEFALVRRRFEIFRTGSGFSPGVRSPDVNWTDENLRGRNDVIRPNRVFVEGNIASLRFTYGSLQRGSYSILIRNPGGLWAVFGEVHVGHHSVSDFTFSLNYSPMIAGFGVEKLLTFSDRDPVTNQPNYFQQYDRFNPAGYNIRFGWMPFKTRAGNFGFEIQTNFLIDNKTAKHMGSEDFVLDPLNFFYLPFESASLNLLYHTSFAHRWYHNIRLGAGFGFSYPSYHNPSYDYNYSTNDFDIRYLSPRAININFGYSVQYFIWKNFYAEAGLDLSYLVSTDSSYPLNYLTFRPTIGFGWQFGRWHEYSDVMEGRESGIDYSVPVTRPPKTEHKISLGWHPMLLLTGYEMYGYDIYGDWSQFMWPFNPLGFNIRYAILPFWWDKNMLGFNFDLSILEHVNRKTALKNPDYHFLDLFSQLSVGVIYQRVLSDNWNVNLHAGIGASNLYDFNNNDFSFYYFAVNAGASFQYFFNDYFFAEAGMDISFISYASDELKIAMRPVLALGYQFRRNNNTGVNFDSLKEYSDVFYGLPDLEHDDPPHTDLRNQQAQPEEGNQGLQFIRLQSDNSNRYNAFSLSIGTSFSDPLLIGSFSVSFALASYLYTEIGFDVGFLSNNDYVSDYLSLHPYANLGLFFPFTGKGGFTFGAGVGYMVGSYSYGNERSDLSMFAANFFTGVNIGNVFSLSYTLITDFNSIRHKISASYVFRFQ